MRLIIEARSADGDNQLVASFDADFVESVQTSLRRIIDVGYGTVKMRKYVSLCEYEGVNGSNSIATLSRTPTMLRKA
jgi:hypothetical protein